MRRDATVSQSELIALSPEFTRSDQAGLDRFETLSRNGCPFGAEELIAMVEMTLGRNVRPGKRERKRHAGRLD